MLVKVWDSMDRSLTENMKIMEHIYHKNYQQEVSFYKYVQFVQIWPVFAGSVAY